MAKFLLIAMSLINSILSLRRKKKIQITKIFNKSYTDEQDEIVNLSLKGISFDVLISIVFNWVKIKMPIRANLANKLLGANTLMNNLFYSRKIRTDKLYTSRLNENDKFLIVISKLQCFNQYSIQLW